MARPKAFDPDSALDQALDLFWRRGYRGTSTQDLVGELGLNRSSLYGTFGSKAQLYRGALERYADRSEASMRESLAGDSPLKPKLRKVMLSMADEDLLEAVPRGCFAGNSAAELAACDEQVLALTRRTFERIRRILAEALADAAVRGELRDGSDPQALAGALLITLQGLRVVAKGTRDRRLLEESIDEVLALL